MIPRSRKVREFLRLFIAERGELLSGRPPRDRRRQKAAPVTRAKPITRAKLLRMHRDYMRLRSIYKVAVKYDEHAFKVYSLFKRAGLHVFSKKFKQRIVHNGITYTPHGRPGADYFTATTGARGLLHHAIWKERHGPIPPGHAVYFSDGDRFNCRVDNLVCLKVGQAHRKDSPLGKVRKQQDRSYRCIVQDGEIPGLYAAYVKGGSLISLARPYGKSDRWLKGLFIRHGYEVRENSQVHTKRPNLTEKAILKIADGLKRLRVPACLHPVWPHWSLARRGEFIARVRARLNSPDDQPSLPFSSNVTPFDYSTPAAHRIAATTASTTDRHVLRICSQGVIWQGALFYWNSRARGYEKQASDDRQRLSLGRFIWEDFHGRTPAVGNVIICRDGNPNNLSPENLFEISRNELLRENQAAALLKNSRARTGLLLNRSQQPVTHHDHSNTFTAIHARG